MSKKHPIISVTGSSGAGTSTVKGTFDQIFRREGVKAVSIEGDAFHRYNRVDMKSELDRRYAVGDHGFSHFSYEANALDELERVFREYGETGKGRTRTYVHCITPHFTQTDINLQRVPVVDTSNPFISHWIPTADESLVVIRFANPRGIDFPYLT